MPVINTCEPIHRFLSSFSRNKAPPMEHYDIVETVHISEPPRISGQLPLVSDVPGVAGTAQRNCLLMQVKPGSKVGRLVDYAVSRLLGNANAGTDAEIETEARAEKKAKINRTPVEQVLWSGDADAFEKVISCAEMTKRRCGSRGVHLHQANCLFYQKMRQIYEPRLDGLDRLQAVREVPAVRCLLSKSELPTDSNPLPAGSDFAKHFVGSVMPAEAGRQRAAPASHPAGRHVTKVKSKKGARLLLATAAADKDKPVGHAK